MKAISDWRVYAGRLSALVIGIGLLTVTSRRWSATLLASALGFGLFIGVAFGPVTDRVGALGTQVVAVGGADEAPADPVATESPGTSAGTSGSAGNDAGSTSTDPSSAPYDPGVAPDPAETQEPAPVEEEDDDSSDDPPVEGEDEEEEPDTDAITIAGTVLHVNPLAEDYTLAVRGELYGIHADDLPKPGDQLEIGVRALANGTYAEDGDRVQTGTTDAGELNGFVTYVSPDGAAPAYTVSARGASVLVRLPEGSEQSELPTLGAFVGAEADIDALEKGAAEEPEFEATTGTCVREEPARPVEPRSELIQSDLEPTGEEFTYLDVAATVQAICPESGELLLSADGTRQGGADMTAAVPKGIDLGRLEIDQAVLATVEIERDGTLSLAGIASNEGEDGADDSEQLQGDFGGS